MNQLKATQERVGMPNLSSETHAFLMATYPNGDLVLLRHNEEPRWLLLDMTTAQVKPAPGAVANDLQVNGCIEPNQLAQFRIDSYDLTDWTAYEYSIRCLLYLADYLPFPQIMIARDMDSSRGTYSTSQAEGLAVLGQEIGRTTNIDFMHAFFDMLYSEGEIYQSRKGRRWRILYEDADSVPLRATTVETLLDLKLIEPAPDLDGYHADRGYTNAHTLTRAAQSLASHLSRAIFDPYDTRPGAHSYFEHTGQRMPDANTHDLDALLNLIADEMLEEPTLAETPNEKALYWITLSREFEQHPDTMTALVEAIDLLRKVVENEADAQLANGIQELAREHAKRFRSSN